ncbi:MAG TPA: hypothetical protein VM142_13750 [Acidimicrobiales bacterium]|nr:hypothetical protein [Acidimicrobiales bacterium]
MALQEPAAGATEITSVKEFVRDTLVTVERTRDELRLRLYALEQAENPAVAEAVRDHQERVATGRGYPDALPAEDFVAALDTDA